MSTATMEERWNKGKGECKARISVALKIYYVG